jgi:hypothetical protein
MISVEASFAAFACYRVLARWVSRHSYRFPAY